MLSHSEQLERIIHQSQFLLLELKIMNSIYLFLFLFYFQFIFLFLDLELRVSMTSHITVTTITQIIKDITHQVIVT